MSSTSATPTPTPTPDRPSEALNPGTSPPLILAFLAVGAFFATMLTLFGWRRVRARSFEGTATPGFSLESKPILYDYWTNTTHPDSRRDKEITWQDIQVQYNALLPRPGLTFLFAPFSPYQSAQSQALRQKSISEGRTEDIHSMIIMSLMPLL
jgi:hypothetical protein